MSAISLHSFIRHIPQESVNVLTNPVLGFEEGDILFAFSDSFETTGSCHKGLLFRIRQHVAAFIAASEHTTPYQKHRRRDLLYTTSPATTTVTPNTVLIFLPHSNGITLIMIIS